MSANEKLTWVNTMLQTAFPDPDEAIPTRADLGVWHAVLSRVESRLMFLSSVKPSIIKQGRVPPVKIEDDEFLAIQDLNKIIDVLDDVSFAAVNDPSSLSVPIHQGYSNLLGFKAQITSDPILRSITGTAAKAVKDKTTHSFPRLSAISGDDAVRRALYRAYAFYSVNTHIIDFSEGVIQSIQFKREWAEQDESIIYSLLAYVVKNEKWSSLPGVERIAQKGFEHSPYFKTVVGLIKAVG